MDLGCDQKAVRIGEDVTLAALDLLACVRRLGVIQTTFR